MELPNVGKRHYELDPFCVMGRDGAPAAMVFGVEVRSHQSKKGSRGFDVMHENMLVRVFSAPQTWKTTKQSLRVQRRQPIPSDFTAQRTARTETTVSHLVLCLSTCFDFCTHGKQYSVKSETTVFNPSQLELSLCDSVETRASVCRLDAW